MREAFHVVDGMVERLPEDITETEVITYKNLARKGIFKCPYCKASLIVKYGAERGIYFSHQHSEACEASRKADVAEKRYSKQVERETKAHRAITDIIYDELKITSRINPDVQVEYGYKAKMDFAHFPDICLRIGEKEIAISVVTNVYPAMDEKLTRDVKRRHQYFKANGMDPVWFIENKELAIEKDKSSIVLWEAEMATSLRTPEDMKWENMIHSIASDTTFFTPFHYHPSMKQLRIEVGSIYYISSEETNILVHVHRFMKDRNERPYRAFLLGDSYSIPFSRALAVNELSLKLSDPKVEEERREAFKNHYLFLVRQMEKAEKERQEERERRRREAEAHKEKQLQEMLDQRRKQQLQNAKERQLTYPQLTKILKERINLKQAEQMELWTMFMPKIGYKNTKTVLDLVESDNVSSFDELRNLLNQHLRDNK